MQKRYKIIPIAILALVSTILNYLWLHTQDAERISEIKIEYRLIMSFIVFVLFIGLFMICHTIIRYMRHRFSKTSIEPTVEQDGVQEIVTGDLKDTTLVTVSLTFLDKYIKERAIGIDLLMDVRDAVTKGDKFIKVPQYRLEEMECRRLEHAEKDKLLPNCTNKINPKGTDIVKVSLKFIEDNYKQGAIMGDSIFWETQSALYDGYEFIELPQLGLDDMESRRLKYVKKEKCLSDCCTLNNLGIAYEKDNKIELAITTYEQNILPDCYTAHHSFDRLTILYRKNKDYENEIRVIERAIEVFSKSTEKVKYEDRLKKAKELLIKNSKSI